MSLLVTNCPRCGANTMTFDVKAQLYRFTEYGWQNWYEIFCVCRACNLPTIFLVALTVDGHQHDMQKVFYKPDGLVTYPQALNPYFKIDRYISLHDNIVQKPPGYLPKEIENAFNEGAGACRSAATTLPQRCSGCVSIWRLGHYFLTRPTLQTHNPIGGLAVIWVFGLHGCSTTTPCQRLYESSQAASVRTLMTARTLAT